MSKTPLTDALLNTTYIGDGTHFVDFARKLETDRAELIEALQAVIAIMCDKEICGHFSPREIREVAEPLLARLEAE